MMCSSQGAGNKRTDEVPAEAENSRPSSGTLSLRLFCLVEGDDSVFFVDTGDCYIAEFKEIVHKKKDKTILRDVNASDLTVLKVNETLKDVSKESLRRRKFKAGENGAEELVEWESVSKYWTHQPADKKIHVVAKRPAAVPLHHFRGDRASDGQRPSKRHRSERSEAKKWNVNGTIRQIDVSGSYYLDPGLQKASDDCLAAVQNHQLVLLSGARASGKSTRLVWLKKELEKMGYKALYFSFEQIDYRGTASQFWKSIGLAIQPGIGGARVASDQNPIPPITSQQTFLGAFIAENWVAKVVLLVDELSELHSASEEVRDDFLRTLRETRNNPEPYAIESIIAAGTFSILLLNPSQSSISPFNISNRIDNPYFTAKETRTLFDEFAQDHGITIEGAVVEDIWVRSNGHPGMVCLCGRLIHNKLQLLLNHSSTLSYENWQRFPVMDLYAEISMYPTFRSMRNSLLEPAAEPALRLFRSRFAGYLEDVTLPESDEDLANFLTTEGVLLRPTQERVYCMASPLLDGYIRTSILPSKFSRTPSIAPTFDNKTSSLNVLETLRESLKYFDKDTIRLAAFHSYKVSPVKVGGATCTHVPRESVYDTELMGILSNWLQGNYGWSVTGQWHLRNPSKKHKFSDIVLKKDDSTIALGLLATGNQAFIQSHIEKTPEYMSLLSADEAWVVHFTCEDDFYPVWQSSIDLGGEVNVVHFSHDLNFTRVLMNARFKDTAGVVKEIKDEVVAI